MTTKKLCLSLDVVECDECTNILDATLPYIDMVKVHIDTAEDPERITTILSALCSESNLQIIGDRKFADIGSTVKKQYIRGKYKDWADYVTVHPLAGPGVFQGLIAANPDVKMLVVWSLTSCDNLITPVGEYQVRAIRLINQFRGNVSGVITRKGLVFEDMWHRWGKGPIPLVFSPGVKMHSDTDDLGQTYKAINNIRADVFIVGRGIYLEKNRGKAAKKFKMIIKHK